MWHLESELVAIHATPYYYNMHLYGILYFGFKRPTARDSSVPYPFDD